MAGNYINLHMPDSARICNEKAIESEARLEAKGFDDISRRMVIELERCLLDYGDGKPVSYVGLSRYCDSITADMHAKESTLARRQEAKERLQWANHELRLDRQRMGWMLAAAVLLLLLGVAGGWIYYRNRLSRLAEAENSIDTLKRMLNPNHPEKSDPRNPVQMGGGVLLKYNANQNYTTSGFTAAAFKEICRRADVPVQAFANRADVPGGRTLGNLLGHQIAIPMVDTGLGQLAMHSAVETASCADAEYMARVCAEFYNTPIFQPADGVWQLGQ